MNPIVQEFLEKKIAEKREKELKLRNEHLISLGLVDKDKTCKVRCSPYDENAISDNKTNIYYIIKYNAIDVTDEEYAEICKYDIIKEELNSADIKMKKDISSIKSWVKFWSIFSIVFMVIAIIVMLANR